MTNKDELHEILIASGFQVTKERVGYGGRYKILYGYESRINSLTISVFYYKVDSARYKKDDVVSIKLYTTHDDIFHWDSEPTPEEFLDKIRKLNILHYEELLYHLDLFV